MSLGKKLVAGIEIGGTSAAVAISDRIGNIIWKKKGIPTGTEVEPAQAIVNLCNTLKESGYTFLCIQIFYHDFSVAKPTGQVFGPTSPSAVKPFAF